MSLRWKLLIVVLATSLAFSGIAYVIQRLAVLPEFAAVELAEARADVSRGLCALHRDTEFLASCAADYGAWDDTYQFVQAANEDYQADNLIPESFKNLRLNLLAVVRSDGTLVWGELRAAGGGELLNDVGLLAELTRTDHPLVAHTTPESQVSGVLVAPVGLMLIGSAAITTSKRDAPVRGAVIMGRFLDDDAVSDLAERTNVALQVRPIDVTRDDDRVLAQRLGDDGAVWTDSADPSVLRSYTRVSDVFGRPALWLRADRPRVVSQRAAAAARTALATSAAGGAALCALLWFTLSRVVVRPLDRVTRHAVRVGNEDDLRARLNLTTRDEIGVLAREFDRMVDHLARSRAETVDIAHNAGKARVAADVLHNVGNVLNSVNVAASVIKDKLRASEVETVGLAARLLVEHEQDLAAFMTTDDRGRRLPQFLAALGEQLAADQQAILNEMLTLSDAIEHIQSVVRAQQAHYSEQRLIERVAPGTLVEQALALSRDSFGRHAIQIRCQDEFAGEALLDRHRVLQVLVNLLANAKDALKAAEQTARAIEVTIRRHEEGDAAWVQFVVRDNGVGIAPENLERIFSLGFSTRPGGHGIGLHSAANLAREMGGVLVAHSAGPGRGATFTLSVPLCPEKVPG